jgi:hypothetical protein
MSRQTVKSKDFIGDSRPWSQFTLGGGSGESAGNDSDNSVEETNSRSEPFKRSTIAGGSLQRRSREDVVLRRSHKDAALHRNSIAGELTNPTQVSRCQFRLYERSHFR